jgi:hypothetical protein
VGPRTVLDAVENKAQDMRLLTSSLCAAEKHILRLFWNIATQRILCYEELWEGGQWRSRFEVRSHDSFCTKYLSQYYVLITIGGGWLFPCRYQ